MTVTEAASGTQAATIATEHTLSTQTTAGAYQLLVDIAALASGDAVTLRLKVKTLTGSTLATAVQWGFDGVQGEPVSVSVPLSIAHEISATLQQTAGTGRSFPWSLVRLA